ncbi:WYL domain-containing protein [Geobacter sp.]|uniref:WYL domain-containing protein n=1 Tax=Geobacter sp. TaxID=46610 RepID=UPI003457EEA9
MGNRTYPAFRSRTLCRLRRWVRNRSSTWLFSYQLRRWLMGFGDGMEVLEPEALRDDFREMARNLRRIYRRR